MSVSNSDNRDRGDWGADPELRTLVQAIDPARSLPQLPPDHLARLAATAYAGGGGRVAGSHRRSLVPTLVAAVVLLVAGLGTVAAVLTSGSGPAPVAGGSPTTAAPAPSAATTAAVPAPPATTTPAAATVLTVPDALPNLKCQVPNVDVLRLQQLAFEGTVTSVDGDVASLDVTTVFTGDVADTAQVQAPSADLTALLSAVSFEVGKTYLVSASDGQVSLCGFSAEATPDLLALYQQAYAG